MLGVTSTDLRPAGKGEFDGDVLDITAANGFIASGQQVRICSEDGLRILVEEVAE
jgi:membrane-bound ClpP family serine protease